MSERAIEQEISTLRAEAGELEREEDEIEAAAEALGDGNPDEELAAAIEDLEPAAAVVAEAALDAGRPDLAAEVVSATLTTLADWAESAEELADTLETVAAEIGDEEAIEAAAGATVAAEEAGEATEGTLEEAGVSEVMAAQVVEPDVAPEPTHWLLRRRNVQGW